jgi:dihydrofolate synthase/folylpolyglutamate synthase
MKKKSPLSALFPDTAAVHAFLDAMPMFSKTGPAAARFGLEGIRLLCDGMGNPQRDFKCIHVAGTNGKGSVCQLLSAVYHEGGYSTGGFTSPHLLRFNERITLNGLEIPDEELLRYFRKYAALIQDVQPTYFELATAIAFWYFADMKVDLAIIETGLGGRLDSTNIVQPELSIITSIGLDHTEILGDTLAKIAAEKAGIIKKNRPVVLGNIPEEADLVIKAIAADKGSKLFESRILQPVYAGNGEFRLLKPSDDSHQLMIRTAFHQSVQRHNIAMVMQAVDVLQQAFPLRFEQAIAGINTASRGKGLKARFEQLLPGLPCYFDGAHNPEAFQHMLDEVKKMAGNRKKVLVFSIMRDKLNLTMRSMLSQFDEIYYFDTNNNRSKIFSDIKRLMPEVRRFNDQKWLSLLEEMRQPTPASFDTLPSAEQVHSDCNDSSASITPGASFVVFSGSLYFYSQVTDLIQRTSL